MMAHKIGQYFNQQKDKFLNPSLDYVGNKTRVKISGACSKQEKITFNHGKIVSIHIAYEIEKIVNISTYRWKILYLVQLN